MNPIREIEGHGQSIWYDYIQRGMIWTGALYRMMEEDGLKGVTSNPAIFEKAIGKSTDYAAAVKAVVNAGASTIETFETLAIADIQLACDVLKKVYDQSNGKDGFVSLEVSPHLAYDTIGTVEQGLRLWEEVGRDNLMIKVPATRDGLPAIEQLISEGVNVNVTLLFAVDRYEAVHQAFLTGLERLVAAGRDPSRVASVASFFVSRIDSMIDKMIEDRLPTASGVQRTQLEATLGKVAIANAKLAYKSFEATIATPRWKALAAKGAQMQRLLWASTGTKNPKYRDVLYVEELIGPHTVNTVPEATYEAFKDHGKVGPTLKQGLDDAERLIKSLPSLDISLEKVTDKLVEQGVVLFAEAFDRLMATVEGRRAQILAGRLNTMQVAGLGTLEPVVEQHLNTLTQSGFTRRLWAKDGTLFASTPGEAEEASAYMGWLDIHEAMEDDAAHFLELQDHLDEDGVNDVVLMGMGGSSLAPEVFAKTFGHLEGSPRLLVLDSTVPAQVQAIEKAVNPAQTTFIVASKSGSTTEPLAFDAYFYDKVKSGDHFIAITDPNSKLEQMASEREFRAIYSGDPEVGGRYSALSPFGLVPAAAMGLDVPDLLARARLMIGSSEAAVPPSANPGVRLGVILGELAKAGRDKLTFVTSSGISALGGWLEQLIAESTGKHGKGIVPVDGERLGGPEQYGIDRVFAAFGLVGDPEWPAIDGRLTVLEKTGLPVLRFMLADKRDLVQEMYRWEIATATAGHVLGINPFDQPNVQESKTYTADLLSELKKSGKLPPVPGEVKLFEDQGITVFGDARSAQALSGKNKLPAAVRTFLSAVRPGDYVAFNAYVAMNGAHDTLLQRMRHTVRDGYRVATTVGYGPRFLHSTGQLHKGGPNNGLFFQITAEDAVDLPVPGMGCTYSQLKSAQEAGDFIALTKRERRVIRIHLGKDVAQGLETLANVF